MLVRMNSKSGGALMNQEIRVRSLLWKTFTGDNLGFVREMWELDYGYLLKEDSLSSNLRQNLRRLCLVSLSF